MKYKIYKLVYNNEIIYIGKTETTLKKRFYNKHPFVPIEIKKDSSIELIEETDDVSREEYWRKYYEDLGYKLYNIRKGDGRDRIEYEKEYYEINKNRIKKYKLDNKERDLIRNKEYNKEYRDKNPDKVKELKKNWRDKNQDKVKEQKRNWYNKNRESIRKKQNKYKREHYKSVKNKD